MAYAEKRGRGWRARWRDKTGALRCASGFASRTVAEEYGAALEYRPAVYSFTRDQLADALARMGVTDAGPMADAIIGALSAAATFSSPSGPGCDVISRFAKTGGR